MARLLKTLLLAALCLAVSAQTKKPSALDKASLEAYVRHLFVWGPQIKIEIMDPTSLRTRGTLPERI